MKEIVEYLRDNGKTISTMESCTGGHIADAITNISGASYVIKYSSVTYSNEFKIKMGVNSDIIDKYSVYSQEVADEMSYNISKFTDSNYGIGITGKLLRADQNNDFGDDNKVFVSIYDKDNDKYIKFDIVVYHDNRVDNKNLVLEEVIDKFSKYLFKQEGV